MKKNKQTLKPNLIPGFAEINRIDYPKVKRLPNGDLLCRLSLRVVFEGLPPRNLVSAQQVPKNRIHIIQIGAGLPVKLDRKNPKKLEIDWKNYKKIDGKKVLNQIQAQLTPLLKQAGYTQTSGRTFNCPKAAGLVHVIHFQPDKFGGQFTVNLAVYARELAGRSEKSRNENKIEHTDCPAKYVWRIGQLGGSRPFDRWWSYSFPDAAVKEIGMLLKKCAFPHMQKYASRPFKKASRKKSAPPR